MPIADAAAFAWPNRADAATLSGGAWLEALPLLHVQQPRLSRVARSSDLALASTRLDVDLGAAQVIQCVALPQAGLSGAAEWRITASAAADLSAPVVSTGWVPVWPEQWASGVLPAGHPNAATRRLTNADLALFRWDALLVLADAVTARYWRIELDDETNPAGSVSLPRLWMAPLVQPRINFRYGASFGLATSSVVQETLSGGRLVDVRPTRRTVRVEFGDLDGDEAGPVVHDLCWRVGLGGQVYWLGDPRDTVQRQRLSFLAQLGELPAVVRSSFRQHALALALEEVL